MTKTGLFTMGGATGWCGGTTYPPLVACTPQGVQRNLRCTPAGYYIWPCRKSYAIHIRL